jgi:hypothetical protein
VLRDFRAFDGLELLKADYVKYYIKSLTTTASLGGGVLVEYAAIL